MHTRCVSVYPSQNISHTLCESLRVSHDRVVQRQVLHLGELNTTQIDEWITNRRVSEAIVTVSAVRSTGAWLRLRLLFRAQGCGKSKQESDACEEVWFHGAEAFNTVGKA